MKTLKSCVIGIIFFLATCRPVLLFAPLPATAQVTNLQIPVSNGTENPEDVGAEAKASVSNSLSPSSTNNSNNPLDPIANIKPPTNAALSISVHPPVAYVSVKPSEKLKHTLLVKNHGTKPLEISVNITDFKADGKTGRPVLQPGKIFNREANPDLAFGEQFTLQPNRTHSINLQIDVSEIVPNKEYPLAIMINARGGGQGLSEANATSTSQVAGTLVSNLIVFIGHEEDNQGKLEIAQLNLPKLVDSFAGIRFDLLAKNTGVTATPIQGRASIKNIFKQTISEYIFYPDMVLANSSRIVRGTELNTDIMDSEGLLDPSKVETLYTQFHYKPPFMVGPYQVQVGLEGDESSQTVIAFPFSLVVLAGVGWLMHWGWQQVVRQMR